MVYNPYADTPKVVVWVASSKKDLKDFPEDVQDEVGHLLYQVLLGLTPSSVKPLQGFGSANVLEIIEDHDTDTYRAVYTVKFAERIYVLHCFQKKSTQGRKTPQQDKDLIERRLKAAGEMYKTWIAQQQKSQSKGQTKKSPSK
jgi:phage-related protein